MNNGHIVLNLTPEAFSFLQYTLEGHKNLIRMTQMNNLVKEELLKDISKIRITLQNAKGVKDNG